MSEPSNQSLARDVLMEKLLRAELTEALARYLDSDDGREKIAQHLERQRRQTQVFLSSTLRKVFNPKRSNKKMSFQGLYDNNTKLPEMGDGDANPHRKKPSFNTVVGPNDNGSFKTNADTTDLHPPVPPTINRETGEVTPGSQPLNQGPKYSAYSEK